MECTIHWVPDAGMAMMAVTGSGHTLVMDGAPEGGGRNLAPRPMETLLAGAGGCTAYDVVLILKRGRHDVRDCSVQLKAERAETDPKVFTKLHLHFVVTGRACRRRRWSARWRCRTRSTARRPRCWAAPRRSPPVSR
jgi:putative redox protein